MSTPENQPAAVVEPDEHEVTGTGTVFNRRIIGILLGIVLAAIVYFIMPNELPEVLTGEDSAFTVHGLKITAAAAVLMGTWWITEAIPLAATALVPLVIFPLSQAQDFATTARPYASGTIFLFMGGFFLALAIQRWNLHRRIALVVVKVVGTKPKQLVLGIMIATGFLSMWVSNTATAVMMLPIGLSILNLVNKDMSIGDMLRSNFGKAVALGIAYSASIASLSTLIGTPPNTLLRAYLADNHDITLQFGQWMLFAAPTAWLFLVIAWFLLTSVFFPPEIDEIPGGKELINNELKAMGPMSKGEKMVGIVFVLAALSWIFLPTLFKDAGVSDELIAMCIALVLFLLPVHPREGVQLLDWKTARDIPWDVLLLFGGGLALSAAFTNQGLSLWIGDVTSGIGGLPVILIVVVVTAIIIFLTEMTSNTATAAAFLPIMGGIAGGMGVDVQLLVIPVALAATCAFMLPVATPPNAIAYGSGYIKIADMVKAGVWLNLIGVILITATVMLLGPLVLGIAM
ncbi:MAG: DASS family sodium-coupled anion symporter [bacterium]|nr:DASS family sodium-coupled anion symporter [bacterium]